MYNHAIVLIGTTLSHFKITAKLGEGGMGEVFRAEDTKLGREVAIKVLPAEMANDPERLERFQREARTLAALDHQNIVSVFSVEEAEGVHYLTMGLVEGQSLDQMIPVGGLPLDRLLDLAIPMSEALAAAHAKGITHRDLKPQNVMVTNDGQIKVLDFGLAKPTEAVARPASTELPTEFLTREGLVVGTPSYMSPEQATGDLVDPRSDVFSLGILIYEMATGVRPFKGDRPAELLSSILTDSPQPATELNTAVPPSLNRLIGRCLEKKPEDRYPTAAEVGSGLRTLGSGTETEQALAQGPLPFSLLKPIAAVLAVLALVAAAWWVAPRFSARETVPFGVRKLAVLPFEDLSPGEDQSWFADGVHEALLATLQQLEGLRVTSRTSSMRYRESDLLLEEISGQLGVRWLVEGSVVHAGDRVRITAQLVDGEKDQPIWAKQYERDFRDVLTLQGDIARAIADEIQLTLTPAENQRLAESRQVEPEAFRAYALGLRHFDRITPADFQRSVEYFQEAIAADPDFPQPHAALAVSYGIAIEYGWISKDEAGPLARSAAEAAMGLDPESGEAHHAVASVQFHVDRDLAAAEDSYREALRLTSDAYIYFGYGWLLSQMGRHTEAVMALEEAVELDPRSAVMRSDLGWWLFGDRRFDRAIDEARFAVELDPTISEPYWLLAAIYAQQSRFEEALEAFATYEELYGEPVYWFRGYLHALAGRREAALQDLGLLEGRVARGESPSIDLAQILLGLGDHERLLDTLESAGESGVSFQPYLWPEYQSYLEEPRFQAVMQRFSLPQPTKEVDP